jgi:Domain of unknown function (DUF5069)
MSSPDHLKFLTLDLTTSFPRSPREMLAGYVIAARTLDKCRAVIAGTAGEYHFDCPLDNHFLNFTGITAAAFREFVATGATDADVAAWITARSKVTDRAELVQWNNRLRNTRLCDMPVELQLFLEDYIPKHIPRNRPVYVWFDVYDIEEERI